MSLSWEADKLVGQRSDNVNRYKRNFLRQAVCEFRFPTLMELGESKPPAEFVNALRKEYPHLELGNELTLGIGGAANGTNHVHTLRSAKLNWSVSLKQSMFSLETTSYTEYAQLRERVLRLVKAASRVIDSDFFTRVGLRYINVVDAKFEDPSQGWINPALVSPLVSGNFKGIQDFGGRIQLAAPDGGCLFQHGIQLKERVNDAAVFPAYNLDVDSFRTGVEIENVESALDAMHQQAFDVFDWALGDKARNYLAAEKTTEGQRK